MSETGKGTKSEKNSKKNLNDDLGHGVFLPDVDESNLKQVFGSTQAITIYETSRILNINASIANKFLFDLESKNLITRVGGYSGHYVWKLI